MKPRIGIDAHMVGQRETGNETYVVNLLRYLPQADREQRFRYAAIALDEAQVRAQLPAADLDILRVRPGASPIRIPVAMPLLAWREKLALLHVTYVAPPLCPCPTIVTVHDISFRLYPHYFPLRVRLMLSMLVPLSMRRARRVLTLSSSVKHEIVAHYGLPEDKIVVTGAAPAAHFCPILDGDGLDAARARYGLTRPFILSVGNLQPRKNIRRLVQAYALLPPPIRSRYQLAIVGQALWQHSDVYQAVAEYQLQDGVTFTGYVPDEDLPLLYNAADLFVYPSVYEGFGLPILEAMACGTPVVTSSASSLAEVAGDAGILVDPTCADDMASAMAAVLSNPDLANRLSERGLHRARSFSWEQTAGETLAAYQDILAASGRQG